MARYSSERKEAILKKMAPPHNMIVAELARPGQLAYNLDRLTMYLDSESPGALQIRNMRYFQKK